MRTLFWKEIRQNLVWAVLLLAGLGAALAWAVSQNPSTGNGQGVTTHLPCGASFLLVTTFGFPLAAFLLALLQTVPEQSPDRWALLIHRPLTRAGIFGGKVAAGLSLYFTVTLVPFFLAAWWTAVPGHLAAPFTLAMLIPGGCDVAVGVVTYFAGLLFFLRRAQWAGTKIAPLLVPVALALLLRDGWLSPLACVATAFACGSLVWAARRSFLDYRLDRSPTTGSRMIVAALLVPGLLLGVAFVQWIGGIVGGWGEKGEGRFEEIATVNFDGTPLIWHLSVVGGQETGLEVRDFAGNPIPFASGAKRPASPWESALPMKDFVQFSNRGLSVSRYRQPSSYVEADQDSLNASEGPTWYYVAARGRYEAFARTDRKPAGLLDPHGFVPSGSPEPVRKAAGDEVTLATQIWGTHPCRLYRDGLYLFDPRGRTATRLAGSEASATATRAQGAAYFRIGGENPVTPLAESPETALVLFEDHVAVVPLDADATALKKITLPFVPFPALKKGGIRLIEVGALPDGKNWRWFLIEYAASDATSADPFLATAHFVAYDSQGQVIDRKDATLRESPEKGPSRFAKTLAAAIRPALETIFPPLGSGDRLSRASQLWENGVSLLSSVLAFFFFFAWRGKAVSLRLTVAGAALLLLFGPLWVVALALTGPRHAAFPTPASDRPSVPDRREIFA
ncbi:hypothetical protein SAMN05444156_0765 [Verrucomicrobium sp. GAS474]|uniref:hypothetical protein n=1 Tax=Verrucomicrobium sp. GAS474 TaxID=1882831 RepID=UPI000879D612|nr:hypothetical protein [Verrucomicrobium sp. GAS474]SDT92198.1 hypothetical protein SAMN05444156_0765 [Verrucomicrobium sp. GAS474]